MANATRTFESPAFFLPPQRDTLTTWLLSDDSARPDPGGGKAARLRNFISAFAEETSEPKFAAIRHVTWPGRNLAGT